MKVWRRRTARPPFFSFQLSLYAVPPLPTMSLTTEAIDLASKASSAVEAASAASAAAVALAASSPASSVMAGAAADLTILSSGHWTASAVGVNIFFVINLIGAVILGIIVGYERAYQGRAAGMRTYALVCMASCAVTIIAGYPEHWFGGAYTQTVHGNIDPTRVIQGVLTGIGFLGAGVITKEGANISGLTTAASIWACSAIGLLLGMGFYAASIAMACISASLMVGMSQLEQRLPLKHAIAMTIRYKAEHTPSLAELQDLTASLGHTLTESSIQIRCVDAEQEWQAVAVGSGPVRDTIALFGQALSKIDSIREYRLSHSRN